RNGSRSGRSPPPITRVSFTPAPSDAATPRTLRPMRAVVSAVAFMRVPRGGRVGDMGPRLAGTPSTGGTLVASRRPSWPLSSGCDTGTGAGRTPDVARSRLKLRLQRLQPPGAVDARVACEIGRNRGRADVFDRGEGGHRLPAQPKPPKMLGEDTHPPGGEPRPASPQ